MSSFMKPEIHVGRIYLLELEDGSSAVVPWYIYEDLGAFCCHSDVAEDGVTKAIGACGRLSAPGYLDCTDWIGGEDETEESIRQMLDELYGDDDESEVA